MFFFPTRGWKIPNVILLARVFFYFYEGAKSIKLSNFILRYNLRLDFVRRVVSRNKKLKKVFFSRNVKVE